MKNDGQKIRCKECKKIFSARGIECHKCQGPPIVKPKKIPQTRAKRKAAGRTSVAFWFDANDLYRMKYLGEAWGLAWNRDVVREALKQAFAKESEAS